MIQTIFGTVPSMEVITESYMRLKSVWKVGKEVGLTGQTIHKKLSDAGLIIRMNYFTDADKEILKLKYPDYRDKGRIRVLAKEMNRTPAFLNRKAKELGLTKPGIPISRKPFAAAISAARKKFYQNNEHPRGMKGKKHSDEFKKGASERSKKNWENSLSKLNSQEFKQKQSDHMSKLQASGRLANKYSTAKMSWTSTL